MEPAPSALDAILEGRFDLSGNEKSPDHSTGAIKALAVKQVHGTPFWKRIRKDEPSAFATSRLDSLEAPASKPE
jgi:hypothetical protein